MLQIAHNRSVRTVAGTCRTSNTTAKDITVPVNNQTRMDMAQIKADMVQTKTDSAQTRTDLVQTRTDPAHSRTDSAQIRIDTVQTKTDTVQTRATNRTEEATTETTHKIRVKDTLQLTNTETGPDRCLTSKARTRAKERGVPTRGTIELPRIRIVECNR